MRITALNDREELGTTTTRYLLVSRDNERAKARDVTRSNWQ